MPRLMVLDDDIILGGAAEPTPAESKHHFCAPHSPMLFKSIADGGLGLRVRGAAVTQGVMALGHMCCRRVDGEAEVDHSTDRVVAETAERCLVCCPDHVGLAIEHV